jgi:outer membrane protein OmpA-like peptidoglycan-associated protein
MSLGVGLARIATGVVALTLIATVTIISAPLASAVDTITQGPDTNGMTDVAGSAMFTDTLSAASGSVGPVTFTTSTPGFEITSRDVLATTETLSATNSPYTVSGNDSDAHGDSGMWSYSLVVSPDSIIQGSPNSGSTDVAASSAFNATLAAASGSVGPVTFTTSTPGFEITSGDVLATTETLSATGSPYTVSGNDSDAHGDSGMWSYSLSVSPDTIVQGSPTSGSTTAGDSATFSTILTATSGIAPVTFTTSTTGFTVVSGDELKTTGSLPVSGSPYTITGTDADTFGDSGMWTYTLSVESSGTGRPPGAPTTLVQTSSTTASVQNTSSGTFTAGPITVENSAGVVKFVTTKSSVDVAVSSAGLISTTGPLSVGTYSVSGTDSDKIGDTGTWTFTLTVTALAVAVTFRANGGKGEMASETESAPTALTLNHFVWANHTFVDWNTSANGSGVSYANGALFPFGTATELFAQWKKGKVPSRTITFAPNGGAGATVSEIHNTPTAISPNHFTRTGYSFLNWNSKANGSGKSYKAGATYPFTRSMTLYAQWTKTKKTKPPAPKVRVVTFNANGGTGDMVREAHPQLAALTPNHFTRAGYTFLRWNTKANGSGDSYANRATYSFSASTTLYAQWKKDKVVVPPPAVPSGTQIGPFAAHASTLSPALEAQIESLAVEAKTKKSTAIFLLGYGDTLSAADATNPTFEAANIALSRARARAVATYLGGRLTVLGLKGWAISIAAAPNGKSGSGQGASSIVIATLS